MENQLSLAKVDRDFGALDRLQVLFVDSFPESERVPFKDLVAGAERGAFEFYAYMDGDELVGGFVSMPSERYVYAFYLFVDAAKRHIGYGGQIVKLLQGCYHHRTVFFTIEDPEDAVAENSEQRRRRFAFFERLGYRPDGRRFEICGRRFLGMSNLQCHEGPEWEAAMRYCQSVQAMIYGAHMRRKSRWVRFRQWLKNIVNIVTQAAHEC